MQFTRYAIYYTPPKGALATFGAHWLGWDIEAGQHVAHPDIPDLPCPVENITRTPRKYGLHGTIKPPFHLAQGTSVTELQDACAVLAAKLPAITLPSLQLSRLGGFLAVTIAGEQTPLAELASTVVRDLDPFRAPASDREIKRRQQANLSPRQTALLQEWGYPYVMDEFRFHITLTGPQSEHDASRVHAALAPILGPILPSPFQVSDLTLVGEGPDGMFHEIHRYALSG